MRKTHAFTKKALESRTPTWAKNMFRITFIVTTALTIYIAGSNMIEESVRYEIMLGIKSLDAIIYGLSKMFGVTIEENKR